MGLVQSSGKKFSDNNTGTSATFNAASNFTAGNTVVITLAHFNSAANYITGITVSGTAATRSVQKISADTFNTAEIWIASNVTGGSSAVVVSFASGGRYITCGIDEWDNITTSTPLDQTGTGGPTASAAPSVTSAGSTTQADEVVYAVFCDYVGTNWTSSTPPSGYTESWEEPDGTTREAGSGAYKVVAATGSQTATFATGSSMSWISAMATYKLTGGGGGGTPTISSTSSATPANGSSLTITGTNFEASQGAGTVTIGGITQAVTAWSDTSITVTVDRGTNKYGVGVSVVVTNNSALSSSGYALTSLQPQSGWAFVDIGTPDTTTANRITATPDIASGDQVAYDTVSSTVTVFSDGTFSVSGSTTSFDAEVWTSPDGWGATATQSLSTWNVTGTGPRTVSLLGHPFGAGSFDSWEQGTASSSAPSHATSGAIAAQSATIAGTADHRTLHPTSGALASQSATIAGSATHFLLHTTTGALSAQAATISGAAQHQHAATGALAAQAATVAGSAAHLTLHTTTGALSAQSATVAGASAHEHAATGALQAQAATIAGSADHTAAGTSHSTSGALNSDAATIAGSATHLTLHTTTGALSAQLATIAGAALHPHTTSGALQADSATLAGTAAHATLHTTSGALSAEAATVAGTAAHEHASTGALAAQSATIAGTAVHAAAGVHIATGALQAGDASISGSAAAPVQRQVLGGWAKFRRYARQDDEDETKSPQPDDAPVVEAIAPKQRIKGRIRIADIAARLAEHQKTDADALERRAVDRARRKRRQQQEEELLLF